MHPLVVYVSSALQTCYEASEARELALCVAEELLKKSRTELIIASSNSFQQFADKDNQIIAKAEKMIERLRKQEPFQYVVNHTLWYGLNLRVDPSTLIPRPETAELIEWIIKERKEKDLRVLDVGTGSGCIAIALKKHKPEWDIYACDKSADALRIAAYNAKENNVNITFFEQDILKTNLPEHYDIIVSNPPYITQQEKAEMEDRVLLYEPHDALFVPDSDPLIFYRAIAAQKKAQYLYFEINRSYGKQLQQMLLSMGYNNIILKQDFLNNDRFIYAN